MSFITTYAECRTIGNSRDGREKKSITKEKYSSQFLTCQKWILWGGDTIIIIIECLWLLVSSGIVYPGPWVSRFWTGPRKMLVGKTPPIDDKKKDISSYQRRKIKFYFWRYFIFRGKVFQVTSLSSYFK